MYQEDFLIRYDEFGPRKGYGYLLSYAGKRFLT